MPEVTLAPAPARDSARPRNPLSLRATLIIAALCALAIMWLNEDTHRRATQTLLQIQEGHAARATINMLVRRLVEAESNQRGYALTGDRAYLEPYTAALESIDGLLKQLNTRAPREVLDSDAMLSFRNLLSQKIGEMALTVRMRQEDRPEVVNFVVTSNVGLEQMRAFSLQADALIAQAEAIVATKRAEVFRLLNVSGWRRACWRLSSPSSCTSTRPARCAKPTAARSSCWKPNAMRSNRRCASALHA